jgi:hypothetical protein
MGVELLSSMKAGRWFSELFDPERCCHAHSLTAALRNIRGNVLSAKHARDHWLFTKYSFK